MSYKNWNKKEIEFLRQNYKTMKYGDIAKELNRTFMGVAHKALKLKLKSDGGHIKTIGKILSKRTKGKIGRANSGNNNGMWKGNKAGYVALHSWVKRHKPKPKFCDKCHKNLSYDLANISGKYKRDVNDFEWLCRRCHMKSDGRMNNLKQFKEGLFKNNIPVCVICGKPMENTYDTILKKKSKYLWKPTCSCIKNKNFKLSVG